MVEKVFEDSVKTAISVVQQPSELLKDPLFFRETELCGFRVMVTHKRHKLGLNSALLTISHHLPFYLHCAIALMATTFTTVHCLKA